MSNAPAISVEGLGKMYRIAHQGARPDTFREAVMRTLTAPIRRFRELSEHGGDLEQFWALRNVSFEVPRGEVVGIIGRNGAGKSTLLKILSRIVEPTEGRAVLRGRVASLLEVGTGFHPELTGRENIYLNGSIMGMRRAEIRRKFDEIVAFADIEKFLDTPVKRYSSGMYVRLAFAVAAHLEPDILIVDEVLAVGDAEFQKKCLGKMQQVATGQGRTVLFVSHNMNAVASLCTRCVLMQKGRLEAQGPTPMVLEQYAGTDEPVHSIDLEHHPHRPEGASAVLRLLELLDEEGQPAASFRAGECVHLRLTVNVGRRIAAPRIGIGFNNWRGERVFAVGSFLRDDGLPPIEGVATVESRFKLPPLLPGRYTMDISISDGPSKFMDAIEGAAAIEVADSNYLGTTHPYFSEMGHVLVRSDWGVLENVTVR